MGAGQIAPADQTQDDAIASSLVPRASCLAIGETLIDLIVTDGAPSLESAATFVGRAGGAPANAAVALARLGVPSGFAGVVGDDPFGRKLRGALAAEGVDVSRLRTTGEAATTLAFAWKDVRGDGHFWLLRGADTHFSPADAEAAGIDWLAALVVGSVALAAEPSRAAVTRAVELAVAAGVPVCFDVNLRPTLWPDLAEARRACGPLLARATLLKLSLDDARGLFGVDDAQGAPASVVSRLAAPGEMWLGEKHLPGRPVVSRSKAPLVVLTDGERGCWYAAADGGVRHLSAFTVASVEPTGAGDAFTAALISRLLARGWETLKEEDIRYAAAAGALATTKPGAWEGLPTAAELAAFIARPSVGVGASDGGS